MQRVIELSRLGVAASRQTAKHARVDEGVADGYAAGSFICSTADMLSCAWTEASIALIRLDSAPWRAQL